MAKAGTADGRGRWQAWSETEARQALAELSRSGESISAFAVRRGISAQRVYYWKKRIASTSAPAFVAVPVATARAGQIEISAGGVTVRVREDIEAERLGAILGALAGRGGGC